MRRESTERLLALNGDSRHAIGPGGRNRYSNRYRPEPGLVTLGSCTSSTVSAEAFSDAAQLHEWLSRVQPAHLSGAMDDLYERVRLDVANSFVPPPAPPTDVVITPSGTDAEFIPLLVALSRHERVTNVLVGPAEAGSGTELAAAARHFDPVTPRGREVEVGAPLNSDMARRVEVATVPIRDSAGAPRSPDDIDAEVREVTRSRVASGRGVLVTVIAHSKTGVHAPRLKAVNRLAEEYRGAVDVVIDAAQGRFSRSGLRSALSQGFMVIATGSKFFGGPPFAGCVLIPQPSSGEPPVRQIPAAMDDYLSPAMLPRTWRDARAGLSEWHCLGLSLRWWAALREIRTYYSVPARLRYGVLRSLQDDVPRLLERSAHLEFTSVPALAAEQEPRRLLESNVTVFSFRCRDRDGNYLGNQALGRLRAVVRDALPLSQSPWLPADVRELRAEIGQPVFVGPNKSEPSYLRLAIGGREIVRACGLDDQVDAGMSGLIRDVRQTIRKLDAVLDAGLEARQ